jgi:hypothetical protein
MRCEKQGCILLIQVLHSHIKNCGLFAVTSNSSSSSNNNRSSNESASKPLVIFAAVTDFSDCDSKVRCEVLRC